MTAAIAYAELQVTSNFSFLRGASHPDELVVAAAALGHGAIGITDRNTLAGVVRAHGAARRLGLRLVVGARLDFVCGFSVLWCTLVSSCMSLAPLPRTTGKMSSSG